jgi:hypothetical protein
LWLDSRRQVSGISGAIQPATERFRKLGGEDQVRSIEGAMKRPTHP